MKNNDCYRCLNENKPNLCKKCIRHVNATTEELKDYYTKKPMFKGLDFDYDVK